MLVDIGNGLVDEPTVTVAGSPSAPADLAFGLEAGVEEIRAEAGVAAKEDVESRPLR